MWRFVSFQTYIPGIDNWRADLTNPYREKNVGDYEALDCIFPPLSWPPGTLKWYEKMTHKEIITDKRIFIDAEGNNLQADWFIGHCNYHNIAAVYNLIGSSHKLMVAYKVIS